MEKENTTVNAEKENVTVSKAEFDSLMARLKKLESGEVEDTQGVIEDDGKGDKKTCRVKTYEGRPISRIMDVVQAGFDTVKQKPVMKCTVITAEKDGKEKKHANADYNEIRGSFGETCHLVRVDSKKFIRKGEEIDEMVADKDGNRMVKTGRKVRLEERYTVDKFIVIWNEEEVALDSVNL